MLKKGFTLIELMVVISIIALLSSIILASLSEAKERARVAGILLFADSVDSLLGADMVLDYDFENITGNIVEDRSGNNNNAQFDGSPTVVEGVLGKGINIGANSGLYVPVAKNLSMQRGAISFWVKPSKIATPATTQPVIGLYYEGAAYLPLEIRLEVQNQRTGGFIGVRNNLKENLNANNTWYENLHSSVDPASTYNKWQHALVTWEGKNMSLYVNGKFEASVNDFQEDMIDDGNNFDIKAILIGESLGNSDSAQSTFDEIKIYSESLQNATKTN